MVALVTAACLSCDVGKQAVGDHIEQRTEGIELIADAINGVESRIYKCLHVLCSFQISPGVENAWYCSSLVT